MFRPRADLSGVLLSLLPLVGAALIAISRCEDYRHDVYDVTVGSLLGLAVAYFSYRRYYPKLASSRCDQPYPTRAKSNAHTSEVKPKDEEALSDESTASDDEDSPASVHSVEVESNRRLLGSNDDP